MKRVYRAIGVLLLCSALICPSIDAQNRGRNNGGNGAQRTHAPANRPGNNGQRPGNSGNNNASNNRPSNNRPGNSGSNSGSSRPGHTNQHPGNNRPGNNHNRPGNHNPGLGHHRPGNDRPGGPGGPGHWHHGPSGGHHGPMRPNMPPPRPYHRPVPPPAWRPAPSWRPFHSILGVALGTTFNISINALINSGYTINSYGNNQIYLANVPMLNLMWPDAIMFYNAAGYLCGSRFIYSSPGYNMNQYNMAYTTLTNSYGPPVSIQNTANGIEATWWGTGNQFIRLSYASDYATNGYIRYYTTLSFGN